MHAGATGLHTPPQCACAGTAWRHTESCGVGSAVLRQAQENGQIDLYWEYTGTSLINYNDVTESLSADETYQRVKELDGEKGLVWRAISAW